jgi:hypothetical protein
MTEGDSCSNVFDAIFTKDRGAGDRAIAIARPSRTI